MLNHKEPPHNNCANAPLSRNVNLGATWGLNGTPSIIFENGFKKIGIITAQELEIQLNKTYGIPNPPSLTNSAKAPTQSNIKPQAAPSPSNNTLFK